MHKVHRTRLYFDDGYPRADGDQQVRVHVSGALGLELVFGVAPSLVDESLIRNVLQEEVAALEMQM